jgi:hypothetical protein
MMAMMAGNARTSIAEAVASLVYDLDAATYTGLSANFNGSTQYLDIASTTAFGFGTADFTIECWWRPTVNQRSDVLDFWSTPGGGSYPVTRFDFGRVTSTTLDLYTDGTGGSGPKITGPTIASLLNAWHHIAITRQSGSIKMWVDGTQAGSTYSANVLDMGADMQLRIMGDHGASGNGSGNLSNVRVVKGVAVYTGAFTPPTSPLTLTQSSGTNISAITAGQTQLLLQLNATPFTDSSTNALTVTNTGTVVPGVQYPFTSYDATGTYTITRTNAGSISWSSTDGGSFAKSNNTGTDVIYGGPDYVTGQSYTVFMAYKLSATSAGRLLNTQSEATKDWMMGAYNGNPSAFYPNFTVNLPSSGADTVWHLDWATWNSSTNTGQLYTSTSTAPTNYSFTATNAGGGGFNQLRMFSRSAGSEVQTGNIAFVKVYDGVLDLATIQSLHATYKARFGY